MKRLKVLFMTIFLIILFSSYGFCLGIEAALGIWNQDPSGYISYKGESLSVENDLNYSSENRIMTRLKIDMPLFIPNIYFMYTNMNFKETGEKTVDFTYGDVNFRGNVPFNSDVQLDHYDIALYYGIPFIKTATLGRLNIDVGLNCKIVDFKGEITQDSLGYKSSKSATIPIPMLFLAVQVKPVKYLHLETEGRGIAYGGSSYLDIIGRIRINPFGPVFVTGGYRYEKIKIDYADIDTKIEFKGPFVEIGVSL